MVEPSYEELKAKVAELESKPRDAGGEAWISR